jgi:hypothetical protein
VRDPSGIAAAAPLGKREFHGASARTPVWFPVRAIRLRAFGRRVSDPERGGAAS